MRTISVLRAGGLILQFFLISQILVSCPNLNESSEFLRATRTGGFAGREVELIVYGDGSAVVVRSGVRSKYQLSQNEFKELQAALETADFSHLKRAYAPDNGAPDAYEYQITHQGKRVRILDADPPPYLIPLLNILNHLMETL